MIQWYFTQIRLHGAFFVEAKLVPISVTFIEKRSQIKYP